MGNLAQLQAQSRASSPLFGNPLGDYANINDISYGLSLDENALFGSGATGAYADLSLNGLTAPPAPIITTAGTAASQTWSYILADISNVGAAPSAAGSIATGAATLTVVNYNIVQMTVTPGHTYNLYRSATGGTPSSLGLLSTFTVPLSQTSSVNVYNDIGLAATAADIPTQNTTGSIYLPGPAFVQTVFSGSGTSGFGGKVVVTNGSGVTLTAAQCLADILVRTGHAGVSDALPTAALLVGSAGQGVKAGAIHKLEYRNEGTGTLTITGSATGITLRSGDTPGITTLQSRIITFVFTTLTPGDRKSVV